MTYNIQDYSMLIGMTGFSDELLNTHFTLYQGYVNNTNKTMDKLASMLAAGTQGTPEFAELKRRFGWEFNGMRLHELYFENMGGNGKLPDSSPLSSAINTNFGSYANWETDFKATASMRGIGWVILYSDPKSGKLFNQWINEHDCGHPAGANPIMVIDVFEHAFLTEYGLKRAAYIDAFLNNIDWKVAAERLV